MNHNPVDSQEQNSADFYFKQGVLQSFQGHLLEAIKNLKQSLVLNPQHTEASLCLSILLNDTGQYHGGNEAFSQAKQSLYQPNHKIDEMFAKKHQEIADLYASYHRYEEALQSYREGLRLNPQSIDLRIRLIEVYLKKHWSSRALQELEKLQHDHPKDPRSYLYLGLFYFHQGNLIEAELQWEKLLQIDPNHLQAQHFLKHIKQERNPYIRETANTQQVTVAQSQQESGEQPQG